MPKTASRPTNILKGSGMTDCYMAELWTKAAIIIAMMLAIVGVAWAIAFRYRPYDPFTPFQRAYLRRQQDRPDPPEPAPEPPIKVTQ